MGDRNGELNEAELWKRVDLEDAAFRGDELHELGFPSSATIEAIPVFKRSENLREVECDACGERHVEHVQFISGPVGSEPRAYISCPQVGRVRVGLERLEVWRIDVEGLTARVASALGLSGSPRAIVDGRLWLLGTARFADRARDVFVVRGARWPDGRQLLDDNARIAASRCPIILVPNLFPHDAAWTGNERIVVSMSEFDWFGDDSHGVLRKITSIVGEHGRGAISVVQPLFRKDGGMWTLSFAGKEVHIQDALGLGHIAELLRKPRVAIEAAQLAGTSVESTKLAALPGIPMADEKTIEAVGAELAERKTALAALHKTDWARKSELQETISKLEKYLGEVATQRRQARKVKGTAQRSRTSVTNAIRRAIVNISALHTDLGLHLKESIKTGTTPIYAPVELPDWKF